MSELPQGLDHGRHAGLHGRAVEPWARRALLVVMLGGTIAALAGFVGQRATSSHGTGAAAGLEVRMPDAVRGGLLFQARITVTARRTIEHPRLVLSDGWLDGLQVNTIEPGPDSETSRDGKLVMSYDHTIPAGHTMTVYMQFQLDPTSVGRSSNRVDINDGDTRLATVSRTLRRFP